MPAACKECNKPVYSEQYGEFCCEECAMKWWARANMRKVK